MNKQTVMVYEIIETNIAVTSEDAQKLFAVIKHNIDNDIISILDFKDITTLTTAFLNESIGTLYNVAKPEKLSQLVKINPSTILPVQINKIIDVIQNAKKHQENTI